MAPLQCKLSGWLYRHAFGRYQLVIRIRVFFHLRLLIKSILVEWLVKAGTTTSSRAVAIATPICSKCACVVRRLAFDLNNHREKELLAYSHGALTCIAPRIQCWEYDKAYINWNVKLRVPSLPCKIMIRTTNPAKTVATTIGHDIEVRPLSMVEGYT